MERTAEYAYPPDLARFVVARWAALHPQFADTSAPEFVTLKHFLSACYQASLMREEECQVTFRAILASPGLFSASGMPPESPQRLAFCESFPLDASELRRLSVATDTQRTLIGVQQDGEGELRIWGLVNSGP